MTIYRNAHDLCDFHASLFATCAATYTAAPLRLTPEQVICVIREDLAQIQAKCKADCGK